MIRVLHTGDLHLDSPMSGLSPQKARQRRAEQRELLERIRILAEDRETDIVLVAGDLFDGDSVYYETTQMLAETFGKMKARIFIAPGNHDPYSEHSPYAAVHWPENVHLFKSDFFERVELPELGAVVYGTAFTSKYRDDEPMERFTPGYDEGLTRLLVLHGDLNAPRSRYGAIREEQLAAVGADYVALGHIHSFSGLHRTGKTVCAYCGCPEGRGFDETGEKGVLVGEIAPGRVEMEFVPTCRRQYREITVDVAGRDPMDALLAAVPENCGEDIVRFRLTGECGAKTSSEAQLCAALADRFFEVQVRDETVPVTDLWARVAEDSLTGLFLRRMKDRLEKADPEERAALERAARFGLAALEGREEPR